MSDSRESRSSPRTVARPAPAPDPVLPPGIAPPAERAWWAHGWVTACLLLALLTTAAGGALAWERHHDAARTVAEGRLTSAGPRADLMARAGELTADALSYGAATFEADVAGAERSMTASMRAEYEKTMDRVRAQVRRKGLALEATVLAAAVVAATETRARVLVFVNQTSTATGVEGRQVTQNRVLVTVERAQDADWRLSAMEAF